MKCRHAAAGRFQISQAADSDSPEIPVQWVEQVVGFSRDDRARHRKQAVLQECGVFALATSTTRSMPTAKASKEGTRHDIRDEAALV